MRALIRIRALIGTYIITCIYIYIYTVVLSSMTPYVLIGMGALDGTGALINKNTFEGGTYSKGWPPARAKSAAKSETTATTKQTDIWIYRNLVPRALFPTVCLTSDRKAIDINIFRSHLDCAKIKSPACVLRSKSHIWMDI